jgi:hypothetical protein
MNVQEIVQAAQNLSAACNESTSKLKAITCGSAQII